MTDPSGRVRRNAGVALGLTLLLPVALALALLPSPAPDLREHINTGLNFPLYVWKNPPLQSWLVGAIALTGAQDAWLYVLVTQAINLVGLVYLVRLVRDFIGEHAVVPVVLAFCGNIFVSVFVLQSVLNADLLQGPLWLGLFYHFMRGARDGGVRQWLAAGVFAGLALLTKYFVVIFVAAFAIGLLTSRAYRTVFLRPGPYFAVAVAIAMATPHFASLLSVRDLATTMRYGMDTVRPDNPLLPRLGYVFVFLSSTVLFPLAFVVALVRLLLYDRMAAAGPLGLSVERPDDGVRIVIVVTAGAFAGLIVALALLAGFVVRLRYADPFIPFAMLAVLACVRIEGKAVGYFARITLEHTVVLAVGCAILANVFLLAKWRDPAPAAAAALRAEWDRRFPCGPAYVLGYPHDAHGLGVYFGRGVIGGSHGDFLLAQWIDKDRARRLGVIVVEQPEIVPDRTLWNAFPGSEPLASLAFAFRRWWGSDAYTYQYRFVAPQDCP